MSKGQSNRDTFVKSMTKNCNKWEIKFKDRENEIKEQFFFTKLYVK